MSNLNTIRTMRDLEHQRGLLQAKADKEERQVRQDIESIKADYAPVIQVASYHTIALARGPFLLEQTQEP